MKTSFSLSLLIVLLNLHVAGQFDTCVITKRYKTSVVRNFPGIWKTMKPSGYSRALSGVILQVKDSSILMINRYKKQDLYSGKYEIKEVRSPEIDWVTINRSNGSGKLVGGIMGGIIGLGAGITTFATNSTGTGWDIFLMVPSLGILAGCMGAGILVGAIVDGSMKLKIPIKGRQDAFEKHKETLSRYTLQCTTDATRSSPCSVVELQTTVVDRDGNVYSVVNFSGRIWMAENLRVTSYSNGDSILKLTGSQEWSGTSIGAYCDVMNNSNYAGSYGRLYNRKAINDPRNLCPAGWHVPSYNEWMYLINCYGGEDSAGDLLNGGLRESWFGQQPGSRGQDGTFLPPSNDSYFYWKKGNENEFFTGLSATVGDSRITFINKSAGENTGMSVRCIKD